MHSVVLSKICIQLGHLHWEEGCLLLWQTIKEISLPKRSCAILTWHTTLQRGWVRSPGHVGTHCTHLCPWNQPWTAAVGYGGPFCCTLEVINGPSAWRSGLPTASCSNTVTRRTNRHFMVQTVCTSIEIHCITENFPL